MDFARRRFIAIRLEPGDRVAHAIVIRPEIVGKRGEERRMIAGIERTIAPHDLGGERDPRRLAPTFDQSSTILDQLIDAFIRVLWQRLDLEHGAAALGDRGQQIIEEGVAHDFSVGLKRWPVIGRDVLSCDAASKSTPRSPIRVFNAPHRENGHLLFA